MNKVEVVIHNDGCVDLKLSEFNDMSCLDTTRTIEYLLGDVIVNRRIYNSRLSETLPHTNRPLTTAAGKSNRINSPIISDND